MNNLSKKFLSSIFLINFLEGLIVLILTLLTPSDTKNSVLGGYSLQRLIILSGILVFTTAFLIIGIGLFKDSRWMRSIRVIFQNSLFPRYLIWLLFLLGFGLLNLLLVPDYRWEDNLLLINRLRLLFLWGGLVCLQLSLPVLVGIIKANSTGRKSALSDICSHLGLVGGILLLFLCLWGWMAWSGMGIYPDLAFWNVPGVPILILQIYAAILLGIGIFWVEIYISGKGKSLSIKSDILICILIFMAAAVLWNLTPQKSTVFAPGPYPPNDEFYPHSDAAGYNLSAQLALVGSGFNLPGPSCPDKGLYIAFLTWLNYLAGLNQPGVIFLQVCVIAVLPVLIYLIGKSIKNRSLGVIAACLVIFKESNAISGSAFITTTMSKMLMSELPTAIFIALFILFLILWVKNKGQHLYLAGALGGIIGLSSMLRLTTYIFVPFVLIIFTIVLFKKWKNLIFSILFFTLILFASITPWVVRVQTECHPNKPFYYILGPLQGVIWQNRYISPGLDPTPVPEILPTQISVPNEGGQAGILPQSATPNVDISTPSPDQPRMSKISPMGKSYIDSGWRNLGNIGTKLNFISGHFLHNLLTTVFIFPTTLMHDNLIHIADPLDSFWADRNWNGKIGLLQGIMLVINLALIAQGISTAWKKWKLAGIIPLLVYFTFCLGLGLARTSGGRYIVPIDWTLYIYYGGGIASLILWIGQMLGNTFPMGGENSSLKFENLSRKRQIISSFLVFLFFCLSGLLIPGTEAFFPPQEYENPSKEVINNALVSVGYGKNEVSQANLTIASGRAINPRFFFFNQDINPGGVVGKPMQYPRFVFTLIANNTPAYNVVLPTKEIPSGASYGKVISAAGCLTDYGLDAVLIIVDGHIYYRNPGTETLTCPLPPIVCNADDRTCH